MMLRWTVILLVSFVLVVCAQEPATLFQQGADKYRQGDWQAAANAWERVLQRGEASGALYYNLGNAYHRMGQIGRSILYYERAGELMPRDRDIEVNLGLARMGTVDRVEAPVRLAIWDWVDAARDSLSLRELGRVLLFCGILLIPAFALWRFSPARFRASGRSLFVSLVAVYLLSAGWYGWRSRLDSYSYAVVLETKVDVFSAPDASATQVFTLHEGTKVRTSENLAGWARIRLADGRQGWLPADTIQRI